MIPESITHRACFGDSSFFYALKDRGDSWHDACHALMDQIRAQQRRLVSTRLVLAETHRLLLHRMGQHAALGWLLKARQWIMIDEVTVEDEDRAVEILSTFTDQAITLTDATSFAVIEKLGIQVALSLDGHFRLLSNRANVLPLSGQVLPEP